MRGTSPLTTQQPTICKVLMLGRWDDTLKTTHLGDGFSFTSLCGISKRGFLMTEKQNQDQKTAKSDKARERRIKIALNRFLKNDSWREEYENAPTDKCKRYMALTFYWSIYFDADDYKEEEEALKASFGLEDWKYLYRHSRPNPFKALCAKMIRKLEVEQELADGIACLFKYVAHDDCKNAFKSIEEMAEQGDRIAQYLLGGMYEIGEGVEKDYQKAKEWYEAAAVQGDSKAQCSLGYMYGKRVDIQKDFKKAFEWYEKSASQGNKTAQSELKELKDILCWTMKQI